MAAHPFSVVIGSASWSGCFPPSSQRQRQRLSPVAVILKGSEGFTIRPRSKLTESMSSSTNRSLVAVGVFGVRLSAIGSYLS